MLAAIPHERALLETDCPYMAPEPVRGTRNDSRNIAHVAAYILSLIHIDVYKRQPPFDKGGRGSGRGLR